MENNKQLNQEKYLEYIEQWKLDNKELIESGKCKKVFLECLPRWEKSQYKGQINWKNCINHKIYFIYENLKDWIKIIEYNKNSLLIKYNNKQMNIYTGHFKECKLGKILMKRTKKFIYEIGTIFQDDKRDIVITDRKMVKERNEQLKKYYKYKCNKCGYTEGLLIEYHLKRGNGCACCCVPTKIVVEGINDIPTTAPWMIKYFQGGYDEAKLYTKNSNKSIYPICPDCGRIKNKQVQVNTIYNRHSIACVCGDGISIPNKMMFNILEQLDINFINEYSPNWISPKRYDFYFELNNRKYIIEMDGGLGHGKRTHSKEKNTKEQLIKIDKYKDKLANEHGIQIIRINCDYKDRDSFEYIKNNILNNKKLNKLFSFNVVNWKQCEEYICNNLIKIVSEYYNNNSNMTTKQIGDILKLGKTTVNRYLKKGTKLDWCNYNPKNIKKKCN